MIRKFIAIAALGMAMAFAGAVVAAPLPTDHDICVLDLAQPVTIDHAITTADLTCRALLTTDVADVVIPILGDDKAPLAACTAVAHATTSLTGTRLHFDPGRCAS